MTYGDLITDALCEIRVARAGDVVNPDDMALGLTLFNRILDLWNADERAVYTDRFDDFTLTPNLSPHTIGPGGSLVVTTRPIRLQAVSINIGSSVFVPVPVRDAAWYAQQSTPAVTTTLPTDVYYQADFPLGKLYFWGVPTTAYSTRIWTRTLLAAVAQTEDISLAAGYKAALTLTLAEACAPSFGQTVSQSTDRAARQARALIFGNNDETPRLVTADAGLGRGHGTGFNWITRSFS